MTFSQINNFDGQIEDMALKDRIELIMEETGIKRSEIARACKISAGSITHWLNGETKTLTAANAHALAARTGFSSDWISTGKGPRKPIPQVIKQAGAASSGPVYSDLAHRLAKLFDLLPPDEQLQAQAFGACTQALFNLQREFEEKANAAPAASAKAKSQS